MSALEIEIQQVERDNRLRFSIKIVGQRLRGGRAAFVASNGFVFRSLSCPAIGVGYNSGSGTCNMGMIYLRGSAYGSDNDVLYTDSMGYIEKLKAGVIEYNVAKDGHE